jgi:hypothetical protein
MIIIIITTVITTIIIIINIISNIIIFRSFFNLQPVMSALEMLKEYNDFRNGQAVRTARSPSGKSLLNPKFDINSDILLCGMSATASSSEISLAKSLGMQIYNPKPVDSRVLDIIVSNKDSANGNPDKWAKLIQEQLDKADGPKTKC